MGLAEIKKDKPEIIYIFSFFFSVIVTVVVFFISDEFKTRGASKFTLEMYDYLSNKTPDKFNQQIVRMANESDIAYKAWNNDKRFGPLDADAQLASFSIISSWLPMIFMFIIKIVGLGFAVWILWNYGGLFLTAIAGFFGAIFSYLVELIAYLINIFGGSDKPELAYYIEKNMLQDFAAPLVIAHQNEETKVNEAIASLMASMNDMLGIVHKII